MSLKLEDIPENLRQMDGAKIARVDAVNFKPHPFTIGPRHVEHASKYHSGMLGQETLDKIGCAARGCGRPASEHTHDTVAFIELQRDVTNADITAWLKAVIEVTKDKGLDGFAMLETPAKYRVKDSLDKSTDSE